MTMSTTELEQALRALRLSGMECDDEGPCAAKSPRMRMDFLEAFSWLVQRRTGSASLAPPRPALHPLRASRAQRPEGFRLDLQRAAAETRRARSGHAAVSRRERGLALDRAARHGEEPCRESARTARRATRLQSTVPRSASADRRPRRSPRTPGSSGPTAASNSRPSISS